MVKVRVSVYGLVLALAVVSTTVAAGACSALTGVDKYDVNDCPKGDCSKTDASAGGDATLDDGATTDGVAPSDGAVDTFTCPAGTSLVTLTLTGQSTTVTVDQGGGGTSTVLVPPNPGSACLPIGPNRLRSNGGKGSWSCTSGCTEMQQDTDQFTFQNPPGGATITANLQN